MRGRSPSRSLYAHYTEPEQDESHEPYEYPLWAATFLDFVGRTGNVHLAAEAAGVSYMTVRRHLRGDRQGQRANLRRANPQFVEDFEEAMDIAVDQLRLQAWKRAAAGSDKLMIFLLQAHDPDLYRPPKVHEIRDERASDGEREEMLNRLLARFAPHALPSGDAPHVEQFLAIQEQALDGSFAELVESTPDSDDDEEED